MHLSSWNASCRALPMTLVAVAGRSSVNDQKFPSGKHIPCPFPRGNRLQGKGFHGYVHNKIWCCQICDAHLNGKQFLVHQRSSKHKAAVHAALSRM